MTKTLMQSSLPWWRTDQYLSDEPVPAAFDRLAGPHGVALVKTWPDGRTTAGWGLVGKEGRDGFLLRYNRKEFDGRRVLYGYGKDRWAFAFVMRSVRMVCIDIDGKNGGLEHAKKLGILPLTLAETSKSGDGYHLFFEMDEPWDSVTGFGKLGDRIGLEQGVDIRAVGCVYHYKSQRWNGRAVAKLPDYLYEQLSARDQKVAATKARIHSVLAGDDEMEILMMQDEMIADLAKPIPAGKRNNTLFAIGQQMQEANVPHWEDLLTNRAIDLNLPDEEIDKLVANIQRYAPAQP